MTDAQSSAVEAVARTEPHEDIRSALQSCLEVLNLAAGEGLHYRMGGHVWDAGDAFLGLCSAIAFDHDATPRQLADGVVDCLAATPAPSDQAPDAWIVEVISGPTYGKRRRVIDAKQYDVESDAFWIEGAREKHKVTRLYAHHAPSDQAGWQDIATAPKDGGEFLSYGGVDNLAGKVQPTRWLSPGPYTTESGKNAQGERRYQWPDGFYWAGYDGFVGPVSPEVWMPLPTAPTLTAGEGGGDEAR